MKKLIVLLAIIMCSCAVKPTKSEKHNHPNQRKVHVEMGTCPTYPSVKHYRKHSKRHDPTKCNYAKTWEATGPQFKTFRTYKPKKNRF